MSCDNPAICHHDEGVYAAPAHGCNGTAEDCQATCPIPVPVCATCGERL